MLEDLVYKEFHNQFEKLFLEYSKYNSHTNISAIKDKAEVFQKHFIDSLAVLLVLDKLIPPRLAQKSLQKIKVLDLGTGGGFPALPLAIVRKDLQILAIDSTGKKIKFVNEAAAKLGLDNLTALTARAEDLAHDAQYRESFDLVVSRAVAETKILVELAGAFIKVGGFFIAYKKTSIEDELLNSSNACKTMGLESIEPFQYADFRQLLILRKNKTSQSQYPRANAAIKKTPL